MDVDKVAQLDTFWLSHTDVILGHIHGSVQTYQRYVYGVDYVDVGLLCWKRVPKCIDYTTGMLDWY